MLETAWLTPDLKALLIHWGILALLGYAITQNFKRVPIIDRANSEVVALFVHIPLGILACVTGFYTVPTTKELTYPQQVAWGVALGFMAWGTARAIYDHVHQRFFPKKEIKKASSVTRTTEADGDVVVQVEHTTEEKTNVEAK